MARYRRARSPPRILPAAWTRTRSARAPRNNSRSRSMEHEHEASCIIMNGVTGRMEPVSIPEFPTNREINREFLRIRPLDAILSDDKRANAKAFSENPYPTEQGIILAEQGIPTQKQGN